MPKKSVLSKPDYVAKLPREGFSMHQAFNFTSSTGMLLPVLFDDLSPSEKIHVSFDLFTRTQDVTSCPEVNIDEFIDVFFVPLRKLYSPADNLMVAVDDFHSSVFGEGGLVDVKANLSNAKIMPVIDLTDLVNQGSPNYNDWSAIFHGTRGLNVPAVFDAPVYNTMRLFDHLGLNPELPFVAKNPLEVLKADYNPTALSPRYLLAYQAIYYDYYRLSNWEANRPYAYNVDNVKPNEEIFNSLFYKTNQQRLASLLELHYRPFQRDYFKAIEPSPLIQSTGVLTEMLSDNTSDLYNPFSFVGKRPVSANSSGNTISISNIYQLASVDTSSNITGIASLRNAYAWQKMLKIQGRAGAHYDDQVLAHFGYKVPKGIGNEVYFLGSHHQKIEMSQVVATATTTDGSALGEIGGRGYARAHSNNIEFTAPCHGILMAIYSCVPKLSYITGLDKLHTALTRYDFPQPEFDKLGMQPLYGFELRPVDVTATNRIGWQNRYQHFKVKYDRSTHAFGHAAGDDDFEYSRAPFADWVLTNVGARFFSSSLENPLFNLLSSPFDLDNIMLTRYGHDELNTIGTWATELYARDPLVHFLKTTYYKTSWMSKFGDEI